MVILEEMRAISVDNFVKLDLLIIVCQSNITDIFFVARFLKTLTPPPIKSSTQKEGTGSYQNGVRV